MANQHAQNRLIVYALLPLSILYLGLHLFVQYRHVPVYVSRIASMPAELAANLHMREHGIDPVVTIESPYENAEDKILSLAEIRRIRKSMAWHSLMPALIDSLTIQSRTRVVARRITSRAMTEYQLVKHDDRWIVESMTSNGLER